MAIAKLGLMPMFQHKTLVHFVHCGNVGVDVQALGNRSMAEFGSLSADYDKMSIKTISQQMANDF